MLTQEVASLVELISKRLCDDLVLVQNNYQFLEKHPELHTTLHDFRELHLGDVELIGDRTLKATLIGSVQVRSEQSTLEDESQDRGVLPIEGDLFDCLLESFHVDLV